MYVTVNFKDAPQNTAVVPVKSVLQMNENSFVFLQAAPGRFIRRKVQTAATDAGKMVILSGLKPGETIVSEGGFYLLEAK
ncbi:Multidrug resistance protein MdtA [compost metagenome]